ncbi:MAG: penicillin acylase family protein [Proteobacteria bacterium]|nr:penicillin acylase family protein [Pseudomonadota bacterium]MBU1387347.1 penicillin acylase family protein [Pseudomonadota bacterium]MBU1541632.1 penicillin acylase family protein [Pseudomonadota bacterium]MBU2430955.1 penicillin acylase family protein [Pseudomonadota bacterium]MBU2482069.1 penicillin acylase family protein [Pseudomonadota bacterium]
MGKFIKKAGLGVFIVVLVLIGCCTWYFNSRKAVRSGDITLPGLTGLVTVRFDTFAIPHIYADNETDAYYALGYLHAQDRLFHMEVLRRLAKGELCEILGPELKSMDSLFRTLRLRQFGKEFIRNADKTTPAFKVSQAYLDGINHYMHTRPAPVGFDLLQIEKKDFELSDIISVAGYMAYSFAAGFKTDPVLTFIRDELGQAYLNDMDYRPSANPPLKLLTQTHTSLARVAGLVADIETLYSPVGFFEGSNAWAVRGNKTVSGKPILSGDPHIAHSCPSVWYEAHIITPDVNFYGHFLSGIPMALLGFNHKVAWTLTMFQNDDLDMFVEKPNPDNPDQVWSDGKWTDLKIEHEIIKVKNEKDLILTVRSSKHGPIINDILDPLNTEKRPVAVSWGFHDPDNDMLNGLYELSHIDSVFQAPGALKKIHAPGLNFVMGDTSGNIGWWAAAKLHKRPDHVDSNFILDGSDPANDYLGTWPFESNPQFINPESGIIVSANHQPQDFGQGTVPGYYNIENRAQRIEFLLEQKPENWSVNDMKDIQLDTESAFYQKIKAKQVEVLKKIPAIQKNEISKKAFEQFEKWDGFHHLNTRGAAVFYTLYYYLTQSVFKDELGEDLFKAFSGTRLPDKAILKIMDLENSPWWDDKTTSKKETQTDILSSAWFQTMDALQQFAGNDPEKWLWEDFHTVEYVHPLGRKKPLNKLFNVGPFKSEGSRDVLNYQGFRISPPPFTVYIGPSTRRIIDFADPDHSLGINPTGQSGNFLDPHFDDQAQMYMSGEYRMQLMDKKEIEAATTALLQLVP